MPGAASGTKWLGTSIPALPNEQPSRRVAVALDERHAPAAPRAVVRGAQADDAAADDDDPLAHRSVAVCAERSRRPSLADAVRERIAIVQQQRRFGVDERPADDHRLDLPRRAIEPAKLAGERAAENALLNPRVAFRQLSVGGEARELGARTRAARRAVVGLARAQRRSCATCAVAAARRPEELDVVDVRIASAFNACRTRQQ